MKKIKETKNIYEQAITIDNIYNMWQIIKRTCNNRKEVFYFSLNLNTNLYNIYNDLINKQYIPGKYKTFMIFEPKARLVMSQSIRDKIVNHFITNYYLVSYLDNTLIDSNVATRKNKGSGYAMKLIKKYLNKILINEKGKEIYCLKIDISKYFYSIDHDILLKKVHNKIKDKDVLSLIKIIISETNNDYINNNIKIYNAKYNTDIPLYKENKGLSIGAMSSQFLAIFYLNDIDHYIKEVLKCKYYIRYMDDFLILDTNKERLKKYWSIINEQISNLKLRTNSKSNIYRASKGFSFLGYKYKINNNKLLILYNKKTYSKINKNLKKLQKQEPIKYIKSLSSYYGYFKNISHNKIIEKGVYKMKSIDLYKMYKEKYPYAIVIIKEGIFFKSYLEDAKILWYLFDYKYNNDTISFGNTPYDKVINKLKKIDLGFVVVDKEKELLVSIKDYEIYKSYLILASNSYNKKEIEQSLSLKLKQVLDTNLNCHEEIEKYLNSFLN